jgi:hypothetical protein
VHKKGQKKLMVQKTPDMLFARNSQLGLLFIALKSLVSATSRKSIANFEFNFSHSGKNAMLDPLFCFNIVITPRSLVSAISCKQLMD